MFSLLAWLAALQLLFAWLGTLGLSALQAIRFSSLWPSQAVDIVVALVGGAGLLVFVIGAATFFLKPRKSHVYADAEGVHKDAWEELFLAWDAVDGITRSADDEGEIRYTVTGNYARTIIRWSTQNALPPNPAFPLLAVTPEQFAEIVAKRSGKEIAIR